MGYPTKQKYFKFVNVMNVTAQKYVPDNTYRVSQEVCSRQHIQGVPGSMFQTTHTGVPGSMFQTTHTRCPRKYVPGNTYRVSQEECSRQHIYPMIGARIKQLVQWLG
jgi:hypothetical protein